MQLLLSRKAAVDARDSRYRPYPCIVDENTLLIFSCTGIVPLISIPDVLFLQQ